MARKRLPNQYTDAQKFYEEIKKDFPKQKIVFTGHSLDGSIGIDIDFKDIDTDRIFTNEEIGQMSSEEYFRLESFIQQQLVAGKVMSEAQAKQQVQVGNLIYVNSYTRSDGTFVSGYFRSKPLN